MKKIPQNITCPFCKRASLLKSTLPRICPVCGKYINKTNRRDSNKIGISAVSLASDIFKKISENNLNH